MNTFKARIKAPPASPTLGQYPEKWTPVIVAGIDSGGHNAEFLGYLFNEGKITHIVAKMEGYAWYYNQYHGTQYSGVSVYIYKVYSYEYDAEKGEMVFEVDMPWSEEFQKKRGKK